MLYIHSLASPRPTMRRRQCNYLTTLLSKVFSFSDFLGGRGQGQEGTGRYGTDGRTNIGRDRLFSENIILDFYTEFYTVYRTYFYTEFYTDSPNIFLHRFLHRFALHPSTQSYTQSQSTYVHTSFRVLHIVGRLC